MKDRDTSFLIIAMICIYLLIAAVGKTNSDDTEGPEDCAPNEKWSEVNYEGGSGYLGTRSGSYGVCLPSLQ